MATRSKSNVPDLDEHLPGIVAGDTDAFARWVAGAELRLRKSLLSFAAEVDTESTVQETLLRVWQVAERIEVDGRGDCLLRYAIRTARNLAVSELRRRQPGVAVSDSLLDEEPELAPGEPADPLLEKVIAQCRRELPKKPALALSLRLSSQGNEPDESLARRASMRPNTFLQNFTRARRLLRKCLERHGVNIEVELA